MCKSISCELCRWPPWSSYLTFCQNISSLTVAYIFKPIAMHYYRTKLSSGIVIPITQVSVSIILLFMGVGD